MAKIGCRQCDSPDCRGCNIYILEAALKQGKFDALMDGNKTIHVAADVREDVIRTQADRIRAMSDEGLAEFIISLFCEDFPCHPGVVDFSKCKEYMNNCFPCWLDWLKQEAQDD